MESSPPRIFESKEHIDVSHSDSSASEKSSVSPPRYFKLDGGRMACNSPPKEDRLTNDEIEQKLRRAEERRQQLLSKRVASASADVLKSKEISARIAEERRSKQAIAKERLQQRLSDSADRRARSSNARRLAAVRVVGVTDIDKGSPPGSIPHVHVRHRPADQISPGTPPISPMATATQSIRAGRVNLFSFAGCGGPVSPLNVPKADDTSSHAVHLSPHRQLLSKRGTRTVDVPPPPIVRSSATPKAAEVRRDQALNASRSVDGSAARSSGVIRLSAARRQETTSAAHAKTPCVKVKAVKRVQRWYRTWKGVPPVSTSETAVKEATDAPVTIAKVYHTAAAPSKTISAAVDVETVELSGEVAHRLKAIVTCDVAAKNIQQLRKLFERRSADVSVAPDGRRPRSSSSQFAVEAAGIVPVSDDERYHASFEECATAIQNKHMIGAAQVLLKLFEKAAAFLDGHAAYLCRACEAECVTHYLPPPNAISCSVSAAKTMLSAFMVGQFPHDILVTDSHAEDHSTCGVFKTEPSLDAFNLQFVECSRTFLRGLQELCDAILANKADDVVARNVTITMCLWHQYAGAFAAWKSGDGNRIADTLKSSFRHLVQRYEQYSNELAARHGVEDSGLHELREGTMQHLNQLREQVTALIGSSNREAWEQSALSDAVTPLSMRKGMPRKAADVPSAPAPSKAAPSAAPTTKAGPSKQQAVKHPFMSPTAKARPPVPRRSNRPEMPHSSADTLPGGTLYQNIMSNPQFVHEMMLNKAFSLPVAPIPPELMCDNTVSEETSAGLSAHLPGFQSTAHLTGFQSTAAAMVNVKAPTDFAVPHFWKAVLFEDAAAHSSVTFAIQSLLDGLISLVPNNESMKADFRSVLDIEVYQNLAAHGGMVLEEWRNVCHYTVAKIQSLEAPARNEETRTWLAAFDAACAAADAVEPSIVSKMMAFCHVKFGQIRMDTANVKLQMLATYLHSNGQGVAYERSKFEEAYGKPPALPGFQLWKSATLANFLNEKHSEMTGSNSHESAAAVDQTLVNHITGTPALRRLLMVEGILGFMLRSQPVGVLAAAAATSSRGAARVISTAHGSERETFEDVPFPEIFQLDAVRMTEWQDRIQRLSLLSTIIAVVQGVISECAALPTPHPLDSDDEYTMTHLQSDLQAFLEDDSLSFDELCACVCRCTNKMLRAQQKKPLAMESVDGNRASEHYVREAVGRALSPEHPVHKLMRKRCITRLRFAVLQAEKLNTSDVPSQTWRACLEREQQNVCVKSLGDVSVAKVDKLAAEIVNTVKHADNVHGSLFTTAIPA